MLHKLIYDGLREFSGPLEVGYLMHIKSIFPLFCPSIISRMFWLTGYPNMEFVWFVLAIVGKYHTVIHVRAFSGCLLYLCRYNIEFPQFMFYLHFFPQYLDNMVCILFKSSLYLLNLILFFCPLKVCQWVMKTHVTLQVRNTMADLI